MKNSIKPLSLKMILATFIIALLITGCGESDPDNEGNHLPDVKIVQKDKTVNIGTKVDLTVIAADIDNDALSYKWSFSSKPSGTTATLITDTKKETSFNADKVGEYKVKFVATDALDAKGSDTVTITAINVNACTSYTTIDDDIEQDTTFDGCYKITRNLLRISEEALLTIKPGSTILFIEDGGINVDGALKAVGTVEKPILFTGEQKTAGSWNGIHFRGTNDARNEIAYATIEYAGDNNYGALNLRGDAYGANRLKLSNTLIQHSSSHGFNFEKESKLDKFENVTSTKNAKTAGVVHMNALGEIDSVSDFTGNLGGDYITVDSGDIEKSTTWKKLSVPINIQRDIDIANNVVLTLEAGVHLVFDNTKKLSTGPLGALKAIGTKSEPILFTGKQKTAGYWMGIIIGSDSTNNILENTIFEYAGGGSAHGAVELFTHYSASSGARAIITSSIFRNNRGYGILMNDDEYSTYNKDIESSNSFTDNEHNEIGYNQ